MTVIFPIPNIEFIINHFSIVHNCYRIVRPNSIADTCIDSESICNNQKDCLPYGDDESDSTCKATGYRAELCDTGFWGGRRILLKPLLFCSLLDFGKLQAQLALRDFAAHFSLTNYSISPPFDDEKIFTKTALSRHVDEQLEFEIDSPLRVSSMEFHCSGGVPVYLWHNGSTNEKRCLCPPTFYGSRCQYQNQRVSMTVQIGAPEWRTAFSFVMYLLDETENIVQSYYRLSYLSVRDCQTKSNIHLLYSSRPKAVDHTYSVRIDAFEAITLKYRASWSFPIEFSFLPVNRLSVQLIIPPYRLTPKKHCPIKCQSPHGHCTMFMNTGKFFCRCEPGWSGELCTKSYKCNCSSDSTCLGLWKNQSICVCPLHKFGSRCYLSNNLCQKSNVKRCENGGQCIPRDHRIPIESETFCACPNGFHGDRCQLKETRLNISLSSLSTSAIPEFLFLHYITVHSHAPDFPWPPAKEWGPHERATTFKKIPFDQQSVSVYWNSPFHLIFAELNRHIYLLFLQTTYIKREQLNISVELDQRCPPIEELFDSTIMSFAPLRRVKHYHVPCQQKPKLACFHDHNDFMCLCTHDRRANCFSFNRELKYSCQQMSYCENGGQCFQDHLTCPTASLCACSTCFFGTRCQLSTDGFSIPLDVILGYRVRSDHSFAHQPLEFKISVIITIIMLAAGLINGILSIVTFRKQKLREFGCGIYLLMASIISLLTMTMFGLKFMFFALIQLLIITDRVILIGQCIWIDFLLKVFLQSGDWLYACVAVERLINAIKGVNFNKKLSRQVARWMIVGVLLFVIGSSIHEPLNRTLIDDEEEKRVWCVISYAQSYSTMLTMYASVMSFVHFIGPFSINIISAVGIIINVTRMRSIALKQRSFKNHLREQLRQHKYLIISPIGLVILVLPRLILAFTIQCIKSARDPVGLFLIGYFISFIPPILTFVVFVLPSKTYLNEFKASMKSMWRLFVH